MQQTRERTEVAYSFILQVFFQARFPRVQSTEFVDFILVLSSDFDFFRYGLVFLAELRYVRYLPVRWGDLVGLPCVCSTLYCLLCLSRLGWLGDARVQRHAVGDGNPVLTSRAFISMLHGNGLRIIAKSCFGRWISNAYLHPKNLT